MAGILWIVTILVWVCWDVSTTAGWMPGVVCSFQDEPPIEATSLLGAPLRRTPLTDGRQAELDEQIAETKRQLDNHPDQVDHWIWLGRRLAYAGRFNEAVATYSQGLQQFPDNPQLLRHRGHRWITLRRFEAAAIDLARAAELIDGTPDQVEPDGMPNAANQPTSTLHTNIYYHLGLAHFLQGDFQAALKAYEQCLAACTTNDMRIATIDWMYMTLRRLGRDADAEAIVAAVGDDFEVLENESYLRRVRMYQRRIAPDDLVVQAGGELSDVDIATYGFGIGHWYWVEGDLARAQEWWQRVLRGRQWAAFGFIAAEAEWARRAPR